jgi:riboflavin kinase/FMN adenylyltransferase
MVMSGVGPSVFPRPTSILRHDNLPVWGVYAVAVSRAAGQCLPAVANIGVRPTIGGDRVLLEAHLLNLTVTFTASA